jgi:hypothetical protein
MRRQGVASVRLGISSASVILALVSMVIGVASGAAAPSKPNQRSAPIWRTYRSNEGGFVVSLPGRARRTKQAVDSPTGKDLVHFHTVEMGSDAAFSVVIFDGPENFLRTPPAVLLKGGRDSILAKAEGKLISERSLSLQGKPGWELVLAGPDGSTTWVRIYLVGQRLYQVVAISPKRQDAQRFLDSFRLILRP